MRNEDNQRGAQKLNFRQIECQLQLMQTIIPIIQNKNFGDHDRNQKKKKSNQVNPLVQFYS